MWPCGVWDACVLFFLCIGARIKITSSWRVHLAKEKPPQRWWCKDFFVFDFLQRFLHNTALTSMPLFTRSPSSLWGRSFLKCFRTALRFDRFRRGEQHRNIFQDKSCETSATGLLDTRRRLASKLKIQQSQGMKRNEGSLCNCTVCKCPPRKSFFHRIPLPQMKKWKGQLKVIFALLREVKGPASAHF